MSSFWLIRRWAAVAAVVGFEVASMTIRLILAPPSALMPPAALTASATSSMPLRHDWAGSRQGSLQCGIRFGGVRFGSKADMCSAQAD
ncbi:MAG: hypothetical protein WCF50_13865, partial [Pseudolabrys sp.]